MKNKRRKYFCYHAFTSRRYRLLSYLAFPALMLLLQGLGLHLLQTSLLLTVTFFLSAYYILADAWVFGGSCSSHSTWTGYLQSSQRGESFLRKALIQDCLARFAAIAAAISLCALEERFFPPDPLFARTTILRILQEIFTAYAISIFTSFIARHFDQNLWYLAFANLGMLLTAFIAGFWREGTPLAVITLLALICSVLFSVLAVHKVMIKLRRSYHDKKVEI